MVSLEEIDISKLSREKELLKAIFETFVFTCFSTMLTYQAAVALS